MDAASDAIATGADEGGGPDDQESSAADPELVPGQGRGLVGCGGGPQQRGEVGDEKVIRFPDREGGEIGSSALPRTATRARTHPQILLRRLAGEAGAEVYRKAERADLSEAIARLD